MRSHFWEISLRNRLPPYVVYELHQVRYGRERDSELEILYTTSV